MKRILKNALLPAVVLAAGCGEFPNSDSLDDQVRNSVADNGVTGIATSWTSDLIGDLMSDEPRVVSFSRDYTSKSVTYDIDRTDRQATAFVERTASGTLEVVFADGGPFLKTIENDHASRFVTLEQGSTDAWNIDELSVYQGSSADGETIIEKVSVSWGDQEVVFDDAEAMYDVDVLTFLPGQEVTVRVWVNDAAVIGVVHQLSDDVEMIEQKRLVAVPEGVEFANVYFAPSEAGRYFTYVDIFDEAAITERDAPYSAAAWGMPYFVTR